ncbi:MAG: hypothetical protein ACP5NV_05815 [Candidatus Woesearchaeota archaeon]
MAKPIRSTPTLNTQQSRVFVQNMASVEKRKVTKEEQFYIDAILSNVQ